MSKIFLRHIDKKKTKYVPLFKKTALIKASGLSENET